MIEEFLSRNGCLELDGYRFERSLGGGQMAATAIYRRLDADSDTPERVVAKLLVLPRREDELRAFEREAETLYGFRKNGLAQYVPKAITKVRQVPGLPIHYFFMELVPGRSLKSVFADDPLPWPEKKSLDLLSRIMQALEFLSIGQEHGDLHAGNILILEPTDAIGRNDPLVRIVDFGVTRSWVDSMWGEYRDESRFRHVGAKVAWPPEYLRDPSFIRTGTRDSWAIGNLLFLMLTGEPAFAAECFGELYDKSRRGQHDRIKVSHLPLTARLLDCLLSADPNRRCIGGQVLCMVDHIRSGLLEKALQARPDLRDAYFSSGGGLWRCFRCAEYGSGSVCLDCGEPYDADAPHFVAWETK